MSQKLFKQGLGLAIGLAVQFALGMAINLYVSFPNGDEHQEWIFAVHNPIVLAHLIVGTLLVVGAIALLVRAIRQKVTAWKLPAISGLFWMIVAWIAGDVFVATQADILSYLMALAFLFAAASYTWGLYNSVKPAK